jgi:hypothetical protein
MASLHVRMIFRFSGMKRAYRFEYGLHRFNLAGSASYSADLGWHVVTDSRCLANAAELIPYLKGAR